MVDNVDLSTLGLSDVRGRCPEGLSIIPQDPFLFAGTLRECLDPFGACDDESLLDALASVRMLHSERRSSGGSNYGGGGNYDILDSRVEEGGANYSVGERSLLVLARAMLARPKLLLMDEATGKLVKPGCRDFFGHIKTYLYLILYFHPNFKQPALMERPTDSSKEC